MGDKRGATSPPEKQKAKKGKGSLSPSYSEATRGQDSKEIGEWKLVEKKKKNKKKTEKKDGKKAQKEE